MFKRINNWHLSALVAIVSIFSLVLVQQYVTAQGWEDPVEVPGGTPANTIVLNPLNQDLQLNDYDIIGEDIIINSAVDSDAEDVLVIQQGRFCLGGVCASDWSAAGLWTKKVDPDDDIYYMNGNVAIGHTSTGGATFSVEGITGGEDLLRLYDGGIKKFSINESGDLAIGANLISNDASQLHIRTGSGENAEIAIQSGSNNHWAIYHDRIGDTGVIEDLVFWNADGPGGDDPQNNVRFSTSGNITALGTICDSNGCIGGALADPLWIEDSNDNLTRTQSNVFLIEENETTLPAAAEGSGTRMVWYPDKSAFMAGTVSGVMWNSANIGDYSAAFGWSSGAYGDHSFVAGKANFVEPTIIGPPTADGGWASVVSGGENNRVAGAYSTIGGGELNRSYDNWSTIAGGNNNWAFKEAVVGGGISNKATAIRSTISGGSGNRVGEDSTTPDQELARESTIGGGSQNTITADRSTIAGGSYNCISAEGSTILGGGSDIVGDCTGSNISGAWSAIGGGYVNTVGGNYSMILGGRNNIVNGNYSFAAGRNMQLSAMADNTFVWGNSASPVSITTPNTFLIFPDGTAGQVGIGISTPIGDLHIQRVSGNAEINLQSGSSPNRWAIYQDNGTRDLRFWNGITGVGADKVIFTDTDLSVVNALSDYYIQLDTGTTLAGTCDAASEYGRLIFESDNLMLCTSSGWRTL